ncbi:MAG: tetratricopeptide repeat protein [Planctomycetota bacterium]
MIRIMGQHASHAPPTQREERWRAAHETAQDFLANHPDHPRAILVDLQDALTYLAHGELARREADIAAEPEAALESARRTIRTATRRLEAIEKQVAEQMPAAQRRPEGTDHLSSDELFSLQNNIHFQLARAFRNQALCYPTGSADRTAALSLAIEHLTRTLSQSREKDKLTWKVYLELARCYRLQGDLAQADEALEPLMTETDPEAIRPRAVAERARVMIADGRPKKALEELERTKSKTETSKSPDLDFARLEAMLSLWKSASASQDETRAETWKQKAAEMVAFIERMHGPYWGRRAKLQQLAVAEKGFAGGDVDILASSADELYRKKQFDEAIKTYENAARLSREAGNRDKAVEVEMNAALIEQKLQRHDAAARRFRRLALEHPSHPDASSKHLLAVWNVSRTVGDDASGLDRYQTFLQEHLERWSDQETANQAAKWLGDLRRSQDRWKAAIKAYQRITPDSTLYAEAIESLSTCWEELLAEEQREGNAINAALTKATEFFDQIIMGNNQQWPEHWSRSQLNAALITARLRLKHAPDLLADAQRVLQAAMEHAPTDDAPWRRRARSLLIVALAGQAGQRKEAVEMLEQLEAESTSALLPLTQDLSTLIGNAAPPVRAQVAEVQLAAINRLETNATKLDQRQKRRLDQRQAEALHASGRRAEALDLYRRLASEQPDNREIQIEYAEMLSRADDKQTLSEAVVQWQKVARRLRRDSDDWIRARYRIALALFKRNQPATGEQPSDRELAAQRLEYLKATSNLDGSPWKSKINELLQRCKPSA